MQIITTTTALTGSTLSKALPDQEMADDLLAEEFAGLIAPTGSGGAALPATGFDTVVPPTSQNDEKATPDDPDSSLFAQNALPEVRGESASPAGPGPKVVSPELTTQPAPNPDKTAPLAENQTIVGPMPQPATHETVVSAAQSETPTDSASAAKPLESTGAIPSPGGQTGSEERLRSIAVGLKFGVDAAPETLASGPLDSRQQNGPPPSERGELPKQAVAQTGGLASADYMVGPSGENVGTANAKSESSDQHSPVRDAQILVPQHRASPATPQEETRFGRSIEDPPPLLTQSGSVSREPDLTAPAQPAARSENASDMRQSPTSHRDLDQSFDLAISAKALNPETTSSARSTSGAAAAMAPSTSPATVTQQIASIFVSQDIAGEIRTTELQLSPENLGKVRLEIHTASDGVQIRISAERSETLDLLRKDSSQLVNELRQQGLGSANLSFGSWQQREGRSTKQSLPVFAHATAMTLGELPPTSAGSLPFLPPGRLHVRL